MNINMALVMLADSQHYIPYHCRQGHQDRPSLGRYCLAVSTHLVYLSWYLVTRDGGFLWVLLDADMAKLQVVAVLFL